MRSSALPPRKTMRVGMLMIPNMPGVMGLASTSTLVTLTRPSYSPASSSTMGAIILHGEHQEAQKSTSTGTSESSTSCLKLVSVTTRGCAMGRSFQVEAAGFAAGGVTVVVEGGEGAGASLAGAAGFVGVPAPSAPGLP